MSLDHIVMHKGSRVSTWRGRLPVGAGLATWDLDGAPVGAYVRVGPHCWFLFWSNP